MFEILSLFLLPQNNSLYLVAVSSLFYSTVFHFSFLT